MNSPSLKIANERYEEGKQWVIKNQTASVAMLQRKLLIGYTSAAMIMDRLEEEGVVSPYNGHVSREVLVKENKGL